ncbi:MAG: D-glycero-alpha-D-manno-heptose-1,7-bisphosphate 7-phosphatase [Chloroflexota bacterium]
MGDSRPAVFFDRDGVLNAAIVRAGKPYPPISLAELRITSGAPAALDALVGAGFLLVGVTNQPDVARGTQRREVVEAIDRALLAALPLSDILVCYHDDPDGCACRKPRPGLLLAAARRYAIDLSRSFLVGDRWRDVEAGDNAGCRTVFIDHGYTAEKLERTPDRTVGSLDEAVVWILGQARAKVSP